MSEIRVKETDTDDELKVKVSCFGDAFLWDDEGCRACGVNSRCVRNIAARLPRTRQELKTSSGRAPTPAEIVDHLGLETEQNLVVITTHASGVPLPALFASPPAAAPPPPPPAPKPTVPAKKAVPPPPPPPVVEVAPAVLEVAPEPIPEKAAPPVKKTKAKASKKEKAAEPVAPAVDAVALLPVDADGHPADVHDGGTHAMPPPAVVEEADTTDTTPAPVPEPTPEAPPAITPAEEDMKPAKKNKATKPAVKAKAAEKKPTVKAKTKTPKVPEKIPEKPKAKAATKVRPTKGDIIRPPSRRVAQAVTPTTGKDVRSYERERGRSPWIAQNLAVGTRRERTYRGEHFVLSVFADHYRLSSDRRPEVIYPTATRATEAITGVQQYPREASGSPVRSYSSHSVPRFWGIVGGVKPTVVTPPKSKPVKAEKPAKPVAKKPAAKKAAPVVTKKAPAAKAAKKAAKKAPAKAKKK